MPFCHFIVDCFTNISTWMIAMDTRLLPLIRWRISLWRRANARNVRLYYTIVSHFGQIDSTGGKQSGWRVRSVYLRVNAGSTPIDEIFCKYCGFTCSSSLLAYSERGIEDSISNIPLKTVLFFPQHCYISQSDSFGLWFAYNLYAHARRHVKTIYTIIQSDQIAYC